MSKLIGIWGLGVVGESLVRYLIGEGQSDLLVYDHKLTPERLANLQLPGTVQVLNKLEDFLNQADLIIPSPGVDLTNYQAYADKLVCEVDFFFERWHRPIIGITGTLGKTTLTTQITELLQKLGVGAVAGGNIEPAMCDLLRSAVADSCDGTISGQQQAVLELSSFQLEYAQHFAPDLAILTNFYPNHLDRHGTIAAYLAAKLKIFQYQTANQIALVPLEQLASLPKINSQLYGFSLQAPEDLPAYCMGIFYLQDHQVKLWTSTGVISVLDLANLQISTHQINLVILGAVVYLWGLQASLKALAPVQITAQIEHRLEKFHTFNQIDFYNDSKSTVSESTLAAVARLQGQPIILILGGLGKGVDREPLIAKLQSQVKMVVCFGSEAGQLNQYCQKYQIPSLVFSDLSPVVSALVSLVQPGDQVLLSPAGSSYDLFANYVARGREFKRLVQESFK